MKFFDRPISEIAADIQSGKTSARDVAVRALNLIEEGNAGLNAFITVCRESALKRAEEIDALPPEEKKSMPLCGIPLAVKDNICTKGVRMTCASRMLENFIPPYDATVIEFLEKAGAVIVGKTNLDEFAMGSANENSYFGPARNPHNPAKITGGSSGGSAAAVGAGIVPMALGTDTGGSIRQPCSHCGAAGLKPTYGRVSRYGAVAFASSLDQIGPMASDVRDIGLMLSVMAGPDIHDSTCAGKPFADSAGNYSGNISGFRVGMPAEYFGGGLSEEVRGAIAPVIENLKSRGAKIVDISLPNVKYAVATYYIISSAEASANLARYDGVRYGFRAEGAKSILEMYSRTRAQGFGPECKRRIMLGTYALSSGYYDAYYLKAARVRTLITQDFTNAFNSCDVIISPASPIPAGNIGERAGDPVQTYLMDIYTVSANLAGIPGLSVPSPAAGGMPVGVQFMAPQWREDLLLKAGYAVQTMGRL
ncbi:MAG: Asp-tRNA(Asn)/Glu-tRNA(Gln) amidotransferase subunit GatA [Chitinispirillia bacterium]|nr:Asp-tRNA(Asn)/Glu-tRNA(Gln) amidotransferase subunit GatA [Chitinispirillia bacterium]MCL2241755.1 Asp-tRNA(Asn)/Glu-tRNA(Gln) amidotransferase subunit GatA [Chitinispirillia bacterium]